MTSCNMSMKSITGPLDCSTQVAGMGNSINVGFNVLSHVTFQLHYFGTDSASPFVIIIIVSKLLHHGINLSFDVLHVSIQKQYDYHNIRNCWFMA